MTQLLMTTPARMFSADALSVQVYSQPDEMADAAALDAQKYLRETLAAQNKATIILACAPSLARFLETLIGKEDVDWSRVTVFHLDEYLGISPDHQASCRRFVREKVAARRKLHACHYLEGDALQPMDECDRYTRLLRAQSIDLCCLALGGNGQLAFNDPAVADFADPRWVKIVRLDLKCRQQQVGDGAFPHLPAVPQYALTLTIPTLCSAKRMICLASGKRQAEILKEALQGPITPACPASILRRQPRASLYLDAESGSLL